MDSIRQIILRKPQIFLIISLAYLVIVGILKWQIAHPWDMLLFVLGGAFGVYFLDAAEVFFAVSPSPFRSVFFLVLYTLVSFFVVSSSASAFAGGLVLSLYLQLILWQWGEWRISGNLHHWYRMINAPVTLSVQKTVLSGFIMLFILQTYFFLRA